MDVLKGNAKVGANVAVIGAGGIGHDVAEFLTHYKRNYFFVYDYPCNLDQFSVSGTRTGVWAFRA